MERLAGWPLRAALVSAASLLVYFLATSKDRVETAKPLATIATTHMKPHSTAPAAAAMRCSPASVTVEFPRIPRAGEPIAFASAEEESAWRVGAFFAHSVLTESISRRVRSEPGTAAPTREESAARLSEDAALLVDSLARACASLSDEECTEKALRA
jgi:hypothetical protein